MKHDNIILNSPISVIQDFPNRVRNIAESICGKDVTLIDFISFIIKIKPKKQFYDSFIRLRNAGNGTMQLFRDWLDDNNIDPNKIDIEFVKKESKTIDLENIVSQLESIQSEIKKLSEVLVSTNIQTTLAICQTMKESKCNNQKNVFTIKSNSDEFVRTVSEKVCNILKDGVFCFEENGIHTIIKDSCK